jgi:RluA family pseudouridine synthase
MIALIEHLRSLGLSGGAARKAMRSGKVKLGGVPTADAKRIIDPAEIQYLPNAPRITVGRDPAVIYRDDRLAVCWKPPGYLSVPAPRRRGDYSVLTFVRRLFGSGFAVHRLDEPTSGLMMVAMDERTQKKLKDALEQRLVSRRYLAIASGAITEPFEVRNQLVRNRGDGLRGSGEDGREAATSFIPLEALKGCTLVEAVMETGRTHQIRIHLAESRHPVLGEHLYASKGIEKKAPRLALHAWKLSFKHPGTGREMEFKAALADDLEQLRRNLSRN